MKIDSINNGSTDNCGIKSYKLSRYLFGCDDLPKRTVILTVTDSTGLSDTCTANLTIIDTLKPTIVCKNYSVALPASGSKFIHPDSVLLIKKDNCGIKTKVTNPDSITCKSSKNTIVTVTVTDVNGNSSTCTATVTISNFVDADCDGVINVCDVCPNGDDSVDNNGDGKPDCKYPPTTWKQIKASWKCGTNPNRVYIAEIGSNGVCTTKCVRYADFLNNQAPNQFLGPCISCPELQPGGTIHDGVISDRDPNEPSLPQDVRNQKQGFQIIPNPNQGVFELIFDSTIKSGSIKIYNLLGEEVWNLDIEEETNEVQIYSSTFKQKAPGVYRVMVSNEKAKTVQSLIILQ